MVDIISNDVYIANQSVSTMMELIDFIGGLMLGLIVQMDNQYKIKLNRES